MVQAVRERAALNEKETELLEARLAVMTHCTPLPACMPF